MMTRVHGFQAYITVDCSLGELHDIPGVGSFFFLFFCVYVVCVDVYVRGIYVQTDG